MNEYNEVERYSDGVRQRMEEMATAELERLMRYLLAYRAELMARKGRARA